MCWGQHLGAQAGELFLGAIQLIVGTGIDGYASTLAGEFAGKGQA